MCIYHGRVGPYVRCARICIKRYRNVHYWRAISAGGMC